MFEGSLKDRIYSSHSQSPAMPWGKKYTTKSKGLPMDSVKRYGRQILEVKVFVVLIPCDDVIIMSSGLDVPV